MMTDDPYLLERLRRALTEDERVGETTLRVAIAAGRLHLSGSVGSEERRRAAEALMREMAPEFPVVNELEVLAVGGPSTERVEHP